MMQINWDSFRIYAQDSRGVRLKFEDLCRQLFANEFIYGNKRFHYLHSNPNNPGLETEPVYDEVNERWVGFQAKYFENDVNYTQIKRSANEIIKHYTGQEGVVDLVYLFCNKPISKTAQGYLDTQRILQASNISLELCTDKAILDRVRTKYPYLGQYYFGNHTIDQEWFKTYNSYICNQLGDRFNSEFNVNTEYSDELSLFLHDQTAVRILNGKKQKLLEETDRLYRRYGRYAAYLTAIRETVTGLPDVDNETLCDSTTWADIVMDAVAPFLKGFEKTQRQLVEKRDKAITLLHDNTQPKINRDKARIDHESSSDELRIIDELIGLRHIIVLSEREKLLLNCNTMCVEGDAGTGKSQLLAYKSSALLAEGRPSLLLLADIYFTDHPIQKQIMDNLRMDFSFEELIDVLESIGESQNCIVPIFIDALNETWNKQLWMIGLPLIIEKIKQAPMVKLIVSFRPEYRSSVLSDSILEEIRNKEIVSIYHYGFANNSIAAVKEFLDHFGIPFSPLEFFGYELTNPLFLTLYCKTYSGEDVSLPQLYERLIIKVNANIIKSPAFRSYGYDANYDILSPLLTQIADHMIHSGHRGITREEYKKLSYWSEYKISPALLTPLLVKEGLLHSYVYDDIEYYYYAYDQMNDYYCAKIILASHPNKEEVRTYLACNVLQIEDGRLGDFGNIDLFINACAMFADKYEEECIDIIDSLNDEDDRCEIVSRYVRSFEWRDVKKIRVDRFNDILHKYPCSPYALWSMLISNSVKTRHPLNAVYLHDFLSHYKLNKRDQLWTLYINELTADDGNRIVQLIQMYDRGEKLEGMNDKQVELLLTLLGWLLTSSNRKLRDKSSKAMIEILRERFDLCLPILEKFSDINDSYVVQRIYGVAFGACCKRITGDLEPVAEYVYDKIFNQDKVYPDILLRDYARLIIERYLWENPYYNGLIVHDRIVPPYKSDPIPEIEDQQYEKKKYNGALLRLLLSMRVEGMGGYGDFGRYVFQSEIQSFDVDIKKMFNYAVNYILNELGYNEEYFGRYDQLQRSYERSMTAKTERIGKKYQWITLHNMLARISDNCRMVERWSSTEQGDITYKGAWDLYVRDFDPTLNENFLTCNAAPIFPELEKHRERGYIENKSVDSSQKDKWLEECGVFLTEIKSTLILCDENTQPQQKWVCLTKFCDTGNKNVSIDRLYTWSWQYAYFTTPEQAESFCICRNKDLSIFTMDLKSHHEIHQIFNREFPWSPSYREVEDYAWEDASIKTGERENVTETVLVPSRSQFESMLEDKGIITDDNSEESVIPLLGFSKITRQKETDKEEFIGRILHATAEVTWESQYDASQNETISLSMPCAMIVKEMGLSQRKEDGFFYDKDGKLAAFDTYLTQRVRSAVIRKDILDEFLIKSGMKLIWLVDAEKEIHTDEYVVQAWSNWEAVFVYEGDNVSGEIVRIIHEPSEFSPSL